MKLILTLSVLVLSVLFLSACDRTTIITGTVVEMAPDDLDAGRVGFLLYIDTSERLRMLSVGAEGEGIRPCDRIEIRCPADKNAAEGGDETKCVGQAVLSKFIGTFEECQASLLEQGILTRYK